MRALESEAVPVVAVDLPAGIDADTGRVHDPHVRADVTVTFGLRRRAHLLAAPDCGRVVVVDIGAMDPGTGGVTDTDSDDSTDRVLEAPTAAGVGARWPVPGPDDDKYTQGVVAIRAGSERFPGAAVLCTGAAVAATSGMVRYVGPCRREVLERRPEIVCHPSIEEAGRAQAWVVGPGAGTDREAVADLGRVLDLGVPVLLDADGLTCVADHPSLLSAARGPVLLTPHAGEFDRLTGGWDRDDRAGALRRYVAGLRDRGVEATVLLKGRVTLVDDGTHATAVDAGSSWAATAGSGDVLSGLAGALLASGAGSPRWSAAAAALVHGRAARLAALRFGEPGAPIGASDLLGGVPEAITGVRAAAASGPCHRRVAQSP